MHQANNVKAFQDDWAIFKHCWHLLVPEDKVRFDCDDVISFLVAWMSFTCKMFTPFAAIGLLFKIISELDPFGNPALTRAVGGAPN